MEDRNGKVDLVLCLGSSCFSRGNKKAVQIINAFLDENMIRDRVHFHGAHCCGNCAQGAVLRVGDKVFEKIDQETIEDILAVELAALLHTKRSPE